MGRGQSASEFPPVTKVEITSAHHNPTHPGGQHTNGPARVWVVVDGVAHECAERSAHRARIALSEALILLGVDLSQEAEPAQ